MTDHIGYDYDPHWAPLDIICGAGTGRTDCDCCDPIAHYPTSAELAAFRRAIADDWHAEAQRACPHLDDVRRVFIEGAMKPSVGAYDHEIGYGIGMQDRDVPYLRTLTHAKRGGAMLKAEMVEAA